jgi:uncharacterized membrane protein (DUF373 family)
MKKRQLLRQQHLQWLGAALQGLDDLLHLAVALVLVAVSMAVLYHIFTQDTRELVAALRTPRHSFEPILATVNDTLFVIILLEVLRTVIAYLQHEELTVQPFLIIGIISTVRHLLMVGARLSLGEATSATEFRQAIIELAVSGTLTVLLVSVYALLQDSGSRHFLAKHRTPL